MATGYSFNPYFDSNESEEEEEVSIRSLLKDDILLFLYRSKTEDIDILDFDMYNYTLQILEVFKNTAENINPHNINLYNFIIESEVQVNFKNKTVSLSDYSDTAIIILEDRNDKVLRFKHFNENYEGDRVYTQGQLDYQDLSCLTNSKSLEFVLFFEKDPKHISFLGAIEFEDIKENITVKEDNISWTPNGLLDLKSLKI